MDFEPAQCDCNYSQDPVLIERIVFSKNPVRALSLSCDKPIIMLGYHSCGIFRISDAVVCLQERTAKFEYKRNFECSASMHSKIRMCSTHTGAKIEIPLKGNVDDLNCVSLCPGGRLGVTASDDKSLKLWGTKMFTAIGDPFRGNSDPVFCVLCLLLDFVWGSCDATVRLRSVQAHQIIRDGFRGCTGKMKCVTESSVGILMVSQGKTPDTIIWDRRNRAFMWSSLAGDGNNSIKTIDAESIIQSCGPRSSHLLSSPSSK